VECTVNGIGERAGNTSLEEVLMALTLRPDVFPFQHLVDTTALVELSRLVASASGMTVPQNKAFVGENAFAHESGIHQAGVLKAPGLYEICAPELVGASRRLPLGKLSGKAGVQATLVRLGYVPSDTNVLHVYQAVTAYADLFQAVSDTDVERIAENLRVATR
jgi:2-isopropylmalate synthase